MPVKKSKPDRPEMVITDITQIPPTSVHREDDFHNLLREGIDKLSLIADRLEDITKRIEAFDITFDRMEDMLESADNSLKTIRDDLSEHAFRMSLRS